jgi:hypothetical protein
MSRTSRISLGSSFVRQGGHSRRFRVSSGILACVAFALVSTENLALGANIGIDWLQMSPPAIGGTIPNNSAYNVPGLGIVTVSYSIPATFAVVRGQSVPDISGSVTSGSNTYSWSNFEDFSTIDNTDPFGPKPWTVTYTFPRTLHAGELYFGTIGLGATTSFGGGASTVNVFQQGSFLGDYNDGGNFGPTQALINGSGITLQNSVTAAGGLDPNWNTFLGVSAISDSVSSLTFNVGQLRGDGIGLNVGFSVPEPASVGVLFAGGLCALSRRRRAFKKGKF